MRFVQNWDPTNEDGSRRVQRGEVNYSDYEVSHYDPKQRIGGSGPTERRIGPVQPITPSPKFHHDPVRISRNPASLENVPAVNDTG